MVTVRDAAKDDIIKIAGIEEESFAGAAWDKAYLAAALARDYDFLYVAEDDTGTIGYAWLRALPEAELMRIAVRPGMRHMGVGGILIKTILDKAGSLGADGITLEVRAGNAAAQRLYRRAGFKEILRRENYYRDPVEDALIMRYIC